MNKKVFIVDGYKIKKLTALDKLKFIKWQREYEEKIYTDHDYRYNVMYVAPSGILNRVASLKRSENEYVYVMYNDDNELCGWLGYKLVKDKDVLYIKSVFIHPKFQNKGLGKEFIKMVIENIKDEELPSNIEALVDVENKRGIRFFESMNVKEKQMIGSDFIKYAFDSRNMWSEKNKQI